jgi:hypothetical protein
MNKIIAAILVVGTGLGQVSFAQTVLEAEGAYVIPGYNDVAIPGDSGTRFSLTEDLEAEETFAFRVRVSHTFSEKHWVALLAAPLTMKSHGTVDKDVDFNGKTFAAGTPLDSTYRFDSYRLIYRYRIHKSQEWQFSFGAAVKVRDAAIKLEGGGTSSGKSDTGVVPLLSFDVIWTPVENFHLVIDGEALAAPQGRAEDVLFAVQYDVARQLSLTAGYRVLEGGSDNDEVYTFALFHQIVVGAAWSF